MSAVAAGASPAPSLRKRLAAHGLDGTTLLVLPGIVVTLALFVYPFLYGVVDSLVPKQGPWFANYLKFFSEPFQYDTIFATLWLALPVTIINVLVAIPIASASG
jgi:putative spermidine/putrescine transport system permease protein